MDNVLEFLKGFSIQEIISLIVVVYVITNNKFKKIHEDIKKIHADIPTIKNDISEVHKDLRNIDSRMSRLEGGFTERGYWESRDKKIGE